MKAFYTLLIGLAYSAVSYGADLTGKWILDLPKSSYKSTVKHQAFELEIATVPVSSATGSSARQITMNGVFEGVEGPGRFIVERYMVPISGGAGSIGGGSSDRYISVASSVPTTTYRKVSLTLFSGGVEIHEFTLIGTDDLGLVITRGSLVDKLHFVRAK